MGKLIENLEKIGVLPYVIGTLFVGILGFYLYKVPFTVFGAFPLLFQLMPIWLPPILVATIWKLWMRYIRFYEYTNRQYTLLEIKLPADVTQSPRAMEVILNVMYHTDESGNFFEKYWDGKTAPWFSLEIASMEGRIHFYIWMRSNYKNIVESQIYAHYPTVEVNEVSDYTQDVVYDEKTMDLWGIEQKLQNPDPYPIMTYVDFGLDKDPKEEFKIDPLHSVIEFLGSIGQGEYCWVQIGIRAHSKLYPKPGTRFEKMHWNGVVESEIKKILARTVDDKGRTNAMQLTEGERDKLKAMQRNANKKPFDTGMRIIYIDKKIAQHPSRNNGIPTMFRSFEHASEGMGYNGLRPVFVIGYSYKLRDPSGAEKRAHKRALYRFYRMRSFFHWPRAKNIFVMSSEELATLYHFPGRASMTPTLERIPSKRSSAPPNLPI